MQRLRTRALGAVFISLWLVLNLWAEPHAIRLNSLGYYPSAAKVATVAVGDAIEYSIVNVEDGETVFHGNLTPLGAEHPELSVADFTELVTEGNYQLRVGDHASGAFRIASDVYTDAFRTVVRAMYLWRCGTAVEGEHNGEVFQHAACHLEDGYMDYVTGKHEYRYSLGGWHDAGDYNKYVSNAGITVFSMLRAWEEFQEQVETVELNLPEKGGPIPELLAEVKWELDWVLTMQEPDGRVLHKLSTLRFGPFINPEDEKEPRYFTPWGSTSTANFVGMMAMAARIYEPYDARFAERCLVAALKSYDYLVRHPDYVPADLEGFHTGPYESPDADDRLWAAAELWVTTGQASILADVESRIRADAMQVDTDFDWGNLRNLGLIAYLFADRDGRNPELVEALQQDLIAAADRIVQTAQAHPYSRPLGDRYYWGCNGTVARQLHVLQSAMRVQAKAEYEHVSLDAIHHLFGRNVHGRSYVTGLGYRPPLHPHDRRIAEDGVDAPWPGYLVGGANPTAQDWFDEIGSYRTNEIAINWNGALIYALAAVLR